MKIIKLTRTDGVPVFAVVEQIVSVASGTEGAEGTEGTEGTVVVGNGSYLLVQETPELVIDMMTVLSPFRDTNDCNL